MKLWTVKLSSYRGIVAMASHTLARYEACDGTYREISIHREMTTPEILSERRRIGLGVEIPDHMDSPASRSGTQFPDDEAAIATATKCFHLIADVEKDILITEGDALNPGKPLVCADPIIRTTLANLHERLERAWDERNEYDDEAAEEWRRELTRIGVDLDLPRSENREGGRVILHLDGTAEYDEDW